MAKVGKDALARGNFHLKPLPRDFLEKVARHNKKVKGKNYWQEKIGFEGVNGESLSLKGKYFSIGGLEKKETIANLVALNILFPGNLLGKMIEIQGMPERTMEEKFAKEDAFRRLILTQFEMKEITNDSNSGIRAVIGGLNTKMDPNSEDITAMILRGDIVEYVSNHPDCIQGGNDPDILDSYCFEMGKCDVPVGMTEIRIMSEILENPIYIYRYDDAKVGHKSHITAGEKSVFGSNYKLKSPIHIYYDPIRSQFLPLHPKGPKKFGVLKER